MFAAQATPEAEVAPPVRNRQVSAASMKSVPGWFVPLTRQLFGTHAGAFWAAACKSGKVTAHPVWELAAAQVVSKRVALLGDAAHMASPRTGAGAHTAFQDCFTGRVTVPRLRLAKSRVRAHAASKAHLA